MNIVVTGGAGFLGQHLCRTLNQAGHQVTVIDLKENLEFPTTQADVRDEQAMVDALKGAEAVFHLASLIEAGESVKEPKKYLDHNVMGTLSVLEAMRQNNIKNFLFSSSAAVYGEPLIVPIPEDSRTIPINPYGVTKLAMEGLASSYVVSHGFTAVALRYFNLYGPGEMHVPETHAMPRFIDQIYHDQPVTVWGDGSHQRDYIHVADIVDAHLVALQYGLTNKGQYHYFNLAPQRPTTVLEIIHLIEQAMGKTADIVFNPPRPGDPLVLTADPTKAKRLLNWQAKVKLETGIKETVDYFVRQWDNA